MIDLIIFLFTVIFGLGAMISYLNNSARLQLHDIDTTEKRILYRKQIYRKRIKTILEVVSAPLIILVYVLIPLSIDGAKDLKMWLEMFCFLFSSILIVFGSLTVFMYIPLQPAHRFRYLHKNAFFEKNKVFALYLSGSFYHLLLRKIALFRMFKSGCRMTQFSQKYNKFGVCMTK